MDYLSGEPALKSFFKFSPDKKGLLESLEAKKQQPIDREVLVEVLREQYASLEGEAVKQNIEALLSPSTFTICTAHQPNLFSGPLYFIYKILHAIKLAAFLNEEIIDHRFVPVYYMGSEDADLDELNHFYLEGKKYEWQTKQQGAVGRMVVDKQLVALLDEVEQQLGVAPFGKDWIQLLKDAYVVGDTIQAATLRLVHRLFKDFGLVVLIADDARLKQQMIPVFEEDIFQQTPSRIVAETSERLDLQYNVQAYPREINLFYLEGSVRERIVPSNGDFFVNNTDIKFTAASLRETLHQHPEKFSPNVILRGLYQERILPNIAFIGGGGELAYWLQLKDLFDHYQVVFPALILRNSFLIVEKKWQERIEKLQLEINDLFQPVDQLITSIAKKNASQELSLNGKLEKAAGFYEEIKAQASAIDASLSMHITALKTRTIKSLEALEKKMLRAEKRKYVDQQRQLSALKEGLFPKNGLQERVENLGGFYAKHGNTFINELYEHSLAAEQQFCILKESEGQPDLA